jgi:hypothetical protein
MTSTLADFSNYFKGGACGTVHAFAVTEIASPLSGTLAQ